MTLLKKRVFYSENNQVNINGYQSLHLFNLHDFSWHCFNSCTFHSCQKPNRPDLDFANMTEEYPRFPDIHDLHIEFEDQQKIMVRFLRSLGCRQAIGHSVKQLANQFFSQSTRKSVSQSASQQDHCHC